MIIILFLINAGAIAGTVTNDSGAPIKNIYLRAYKAANQQLAGTAITQANGSYCLGNLANGSYKVKTINNQGYYDTYYSNALGWDNAVPITVSSPDTTSEINFTMKKGGVVTGKVFKQDSITPISGVYVFLYDSVQQTAAYTTLPTDSTGKYIITQLPALKLKAKTKNYQNYGDVYYDNALTWDSAKAITIKPPDTVYNINFYLQKGGVIQGKVVSTDSLPISNMKVQAFNASTKELSGEAQTDINGMYFLPSLAAGEYKLSSGGAQDYIEVYYKNTYDWDSAQEVPVQSPDTAWGKNFVLTYGATIVGKVIDSVASQGIKDVCVTAYDTNKTIISSAYTDTFGNYAIQGLKGGKYKIKTLNYQNYIDKYYQNAMNWDEAQTKIVSPPESVEVDFSLALGGAIKGYVSAASIVFPATYVYLFYSRTGELVGQNQVQNDGSYIISGLPKEYFRLFVAGGERNDTSFAFEWYNNKNDWQTADSICISTPGDTLMGVNFGLNIGGDIKGKVSWSNATPLSGANVNLWFSWTPYLGLFNWKATQTDSSGYYIFQGLRTGQYLISATLHLAGRDTTIWYNKAQDSTTAAKVNVIMPDTTTGIDFVFPVGIFENNVPKTLSFNPYPNPFIKKVHIYCNKGAKVFIYDITGRQVKLIYNANNEAVTWDGKDSQERKLPSGIYFYKVDSRTQQKITKKLIFIG